MSKGPKLPQEAVAEVGAAVSSGIQAQALSALFAPQRYGQKDLSAVLQLMRGRLSDLQVSWNALP